MPTTPDLDAIRAKLRGVQGKKDSFVALCPAHDDKAQSLSVKKGRDERVLLHCFAGCETTTIVQALGMTMGDLFPAGSAPRRVATGPTRTQEVASYVYTDADDSPLFRAVRFDVLDPTGQRTGKTFRAERHIGANEFAPGLNGTRRVLYRLPDVIEAVALDRTVYIVEGEKDADRLHGLGLAATTSQGGAAARWEDHYSATLRGADVVILPDNDEPGRTHARKVSLALHGIAKSVRIVSLPGLPEKGDVSDWLDSGRTRDDLAELLAASPAPEVAPAAPSRFRLYSDTELVALPDPVPLVEGIASVNSLVAIIGRYSTYKSFVLVDLALSIGTGADWHGRRVKQGPVVYVYAEGVWGIKKRVNAWKAAAGYTGGTDVFFLPTSVMLTDPAQVAELLESIATLPVKPVAVMIDTVARNMAGSENDQEVMGAFIHGCDTIRETTGAGVFLAHHMGWNADRSRGSTVLPGALDTEITIERDDNIVTLTCTKQKEMPEGAPFSLEAFPIAGSLALRAVVPTRAELTRNERQALTVVQNGDGLRSTDWRRDAGLAKGSFNNARTRLVALGYVRSDKGKYVATEAGRQAVGTTDKQGTTDGQAGEAQWDTQLHTPIRREVVPSLGLVEAA